jgi:hypothetical protein
MVIEQFSIQTSHQWNHASPCSGDAQLHVRGPVSLALYLSPKVIFIIIISLYGLVPLTRSNSEMHVKL